MPAQRDERFEAPNALMLEQGIGVTRNISVSDVHFESEARVTPGTSLRFALDFADAPGGPMQLRCEGLLVHVEGRGGKGGVGASISEYQLERVENKFREPA